MTTQIQALLCDPQLKKVLEDIVDDIADLRTGVDALSARTGGDVTIGSCVTAAEAAVTDLAAFATAHNACATALNGSDDVTDTDYADDLAKTALDPTASTAAALATTATALVADLGTFATAFNTLSTKLNSDGGVTDVDYATDLAKTATAPTTSDVDAIATTLAAVAADLATFRTAFNTRQTKITADCAGTYSALAAVTAAAPAVGSALSALGSRRITKS